MTSAGRNGTTRRALTPEAVRTLEVFVDIRHTSANAATLARRLVRAAQRWRRATS